jgi:hypothetical protein
MSLMLPHVLRLQLRKRRLSEAEVRLIGCRARPAPAKDSRLTLSTTPRWPRSCHVLAMGHALPIVLRSEGATSGITRREWRPD